MVLAKTPNASGGGWGEKAFSRIIKRGTEAREGRRKRWHTAFHTHLVQCLLLLGHAFSLEAQAFDMGFLALFVLVVADRVHLLHQHMQALLRCSCRVRRLRVLVGAM